MLHRMSLLEGTGLDYACYTKKTIDKSSAIPMWILHQLQRCHQLKDLFLQSNAFEHFEFNHSRKWILDHTCRIVSKRFISDSLHSRDPRKVINHTLATWCTATEARLRHDQWWAMRQAQGNEAAKIVIFSSNLIILIISFWCLDFVNPASIYGPSSFLSSSYPPQKHLHQPAEKFAAAKQNKVRRVVRQVSLWIAPLAG